MMKKYASLIALLLCLLLALPLAQAESYVPGMLARQILTDVWNSGKIIRGELKLRLDADASMLGLDEDEAQILNAVLPLLDSVSLGIGAGKTQDGLRLELDAALAHAQGGNPVSVSAAANIDLYGVTLESDLLEGSKVTAKWETLLAMAGMSDGDIQTLLLLRDTDWAQILPQLISNMESYAQIAMQTIAPYMQIASDWTATLPVQTRQNGDVVRTDISITQKDVGILFTRLCTQLKTDEQACMILDMILQEGYTGSGEAPTTVQLCDEMLALTANMTDGVNPVIQLTAKTKAGVPASLNIKLLSDGKTDLSITLSAETGSTGSTTCAASLYAYDSAGVPADGFSANGTFNADQLNFHLDIKADSERVLDINYALNTAAPESGAGLNIVQTMNMNIEDGYQSVQGVMEATTKAHLTSDGGEVIDEVSTMNMYVDGEAMTVTTLESISIFPTPGGLSGSIGMTQSMPALGLNLYGMDVILSSSDYDPAATEALYEIALETASRELIDDLLSSVASAGQMKLIAAMQALPPEFLNLLMNL